MAQPKNGPLYERGGYSLDWDRKADGSLRSPFLAVFWYDSGTRRVKSTSTGTEALEDGKSFLDAFYLERTHGQAVCPACGQVRQAAAGHLVATAIETYRRTHGDEQSSSNAIASRLNHVIDYIMTLPNPAVTCEQVDEQWIAKFRKWAAKQPVVSTKGKVLRDRSLSTIETSVIQLAAALNHAFKRHDTLGPAKFTPIPIRELNRTPQHRSDLVELAGMFRYCVEPEGDTKEMRERRVRERSALHRFLILSVATLGRPDAIVDVSVDPKRRQWNETHKVLALNPAGRRQTKKYRATIPLPRQAVPLMQSATGFVVGVQSVRTAWEAMAKEMGLPTEGEAGMKLVRRSAANIARERLPSEAWGELEMFLGHDKFDNVSDLYAPFRPDYLRRALPVIEGIIDEIVERVPGAMHRTCTGDNEATSSESVAENLLLSAA